MLLSELCMRASYSLSVSARQSRISYSAHLNFGALAFPAGTNPPRPGAFPGANSPGPVADLYGPASQDSGVGNYISAASPQPGSGFGHGIAVSTPAPALEPHHRVSSQSVPLPKPSPGDVYFDIDELAKVVITRHGKISMRPHGPMMLPISAGFAAREKYTSASLLKSAGPLYLLPLGKGRPQ